MDEGPDQEALFEIEGPDEDGCVWICSPKLATDATIWVQRIRWPRYCRSGCPQLMTRALSTLLKTSRSLSVLPQRSHLARSSKCPLSIQTGH